jgi:hypothetical protein
MTCRCKMCGTKNAAKISRRTYARVGLVCDEYGNEGCTKKAARKIRRVREKRQYMREFINE